MKERAGRTAIIVAALLFVLHASIAFTQVDQAFEEYGVGPRDAAMGNAFTGVAEDFSAAFYNPAGLVQTRGTHLTLGYKMLDPEVTAKIDGFEGKKFTDYPTTKWGLFGLTSDLNMPDVINPKFTDPFFFGMAFALSGFVHSYTNYYDPYTPYFFRYQDRPVSLLSLYVSLGIRLADWVSIGGGIVVAPSVTYAEARVRTDVYLPEGTTDPKQGIVDRAYSIVDPLAGVMFRIPIAGVDDRLRIGLTWRDEVHVIDGKGYALNRIIVHVKGAQGALEPAPPQVVPVITISGYSPMQAVFGASFKPYEGAIIASDAIWKRWSTFRNYFDVRPDPRFRDTFQERVGLEQKFFTDADWLRFWALRAGWYYEPSPVPSQNNEWNILDNDKHVITAGFGLNIDRVLGIIKTPVNIDANFQTHLLMPRTIENGSDPSFPKIETGGRVYSGTVAVELAW